MLESLKRADEQPAGSGEKAGVDFDDFNRLNGIGLRLAELVSEYQRVVPQIDSMLNVRATVAARVASAA
ncbi:hypothetical protein [Novosphingobium sp. PhB165]|uniref:hypothetical protein n=1 Tax=Novosphingobium sp. PhB165 TaxID=2485105 RepID=UPI00104C132B|nr:hypothetical protein [Novosphingobium sp. PhB165]